MDSKPFSCYMCEKDCKIRGGLKTHVLITHSIIKEQKENADIRQYFGRKPKKSKKPTIEQSELKKDIPKPIEMKEIKHHKLVPKPAALKFDPVVLKIPAGRIPEDVGSRDPHLEIEFLQKVAKS